jgi:hypothetical protein
LITGCNQYTSLRKCSGKIQSEKHFLTIFSP